MILSNNTSINESKKLSSLKSGFDFLFIIDKKYDDLEKIINAKC